MCVWSVTWDARPFLVDVNANFGSVIQVLSQVRGPFSYINTHITYSLCTNVPMCCGVDMRCRACYDIEIYGYLYLYHPDNLDSYICLIFI